MQRAGAEGRPAGGPGRAAVITLARAGLFRRRGCGKLAGMKLRQLSAARPCASSRSTPPHPGRGASGGAGREVGTGTQAGGRGARLWRAALLSLALGLGLAGPLAAGDGPAASGGVALQGHDPVAYFRRGAAVPGRPEFRLRWRGRVWQFASAEHRNAFEANPRAFLPQFGGHCALSVARGRPVQGDPRHWAVVDGRLYLAERDAALAELMRDPTAVLGEGHRRWPPPDTLAVGRRD